VTDLDQIAHQKTDGAAATDVLLDGVKFGDVPERLARNGRGTRRGEFVEVAPHMRPAERKLDVATLGQLAVAGITVDLQDSLEALEMGDRPLGFAVGRVAEIVASGDSVCAVARRHGLSPQQLFGWRRQLRESAARHSETEELRFVPAMVDVVASSPALGGRRKAPRWKSEPDAGTDDRS
jgi:hypothetical protein